MNGIPMEHGLGFGRHAFHPRFGRPAGAPQHAVHVDVYRSDDERRCTGVCGGRSPLGPGRWADHVHPDPDLAASEASIGLAMLIQLYRRHHTLILTQPARCADEPLIPDFSFSAARLSAAGAQPWPLVLSVRSALIGVGSVAFACRHWPVLGRHRVSATCRVAAFTRSCCGPGSAGNFKSASRPASGWPVADHARRGHRGRFSDPPVRLLVHAR
jgi:hypothetical protein